MNISHLILSGPRVGPDHLSSVWMLPWGLEHNSGLVSLSRPAEPNIGSACLPLFPWLVWKQQVLKPSREERNHFPFLLVMKYRQGLGSIAVASFLGQREKRQGLRKNFLGCSTGLWCFRSLPGPKLQRTSTLLASAPDASGLPGLAVGVCLTGSFPEDYLISAGLVVWLPEEAEDAPLLATCISTLNAHGLPPSLQLPPFLPLFFQGLKLGCLKNLQAAFRRWVFQGLSFLPSYPRYLDS